MDPSCKSYLLEDLLQGEVGALLISEGQKPQIAKATYEYLAACLS